MNQPMDLNEKLLWLSYYRRDPLKAQCADKYKCREYVTKECGLLEELLVPLYGVWNSADDINFSSLPESFVLKCNHGCGYNIIVTDKSKLDYENAKQTLNKWLSEDYAGNASEIHYKDIRPHVIMCEKYLSPHPGENSQTDYKLFCINGEVMFIFVCYNRDNNGEALYATYSTVWEQLFYTKNEPTSHITPPKSLNQMLLYAKSLSKPFPFVRIDFYEYEEAPLLGEMTFTPYGNIMTYFKDDVLMKYGQKLRLPKKKIR